MSSFNNHIENFLDYYCELKIPPEYAVLLKGKWGCGKTWFIKKYCQKLKNNNRQYLYVSLYGITSYSEIENSFFQQIHPVLSSKGMALAGKILKGLIKTTVKIDLDGDEKSDSSVSSQIPDVDISKVFNNADGNILIFDDLERCGIKKQDILGYINHFVEHQGFKVIIIANEDDIFLKDNSETLYINIKEKLIGKTFEITSDIDEVIGNFLDLIENKDTKQELENNTNLVKEVYLASSYNNLRHLKQSLWDFERLFSVLPKDITSNKDFCHDLLQLFLAFSFEIKSGTIRPTELNNFSSGYMDGVFNDKNHEKSKYKILTEKYINITFFEHVFELSAWESFFDKGIIDTELILESLKKSKHFQNEHTANWVKLWHFLDLEDCEFSELYKSVSREFASESYAEIGVIRHVAGMFFWFSEIGLIQETKKELFEQSKGYIDHLKSQNLLDKSRKRRHTPFDNESWGGLGFMGKDLSEFFELTEYIEKMTEESKIESLPEAGKKLLEVMVSDTKKFYEQLVHTNSDGNLYYETPILLHIDPGDFVSTFERLSPENKRTVGYALAERYKHAFFLDKIYNEISWLVQVKTALEEKQQLLRGKVSGYLTKIIYNNIDSSISALDEYQKGLTK